MFYPKAEFREGRVRDPEHVGRARRPVSIRSWRTVARRGASASTSGDASGWPGTDFIESLVLRVGGVETYDAWTVGEIGFTSPAVMEAGRLADDLVFEPGFVRGGPASISDESFDTQLDHHAHIATSVTGETEPECWLYHQADFMLRASFRRGDQIGTDLDFFVLPPIDPSQPTPIDRYARASRRPSSTGPRFGRSWSSSPVRSGASAGPPTLERCVHLP